MNNEILKSGIPNGIYCYDENGVCPFWGIDKTKPEQENGYCVFIPLNDWESEGFPLLWDQVKECGINEGFGNE